MKKTILTLSILAMSGLTQLFAQAMGNNQYNNNQNINQNIQYTGREPVSNAVITNDNEFMIEVNGLYNLVADNYVAVFNLVQVGETIESTDQMMSSRISNFMRRLKAVGIDTTKVFVDIISFVPKYDIQTESKLFSKTYNEIPAGFELQKNVSIVYKNSNKLNEIVSAAASSEIYDLVKVDYFIANLQKMLDSLREKCLLEVKSKTKAFEMIRFKTDTLRKDIAENFITVYPPTRYLSYQAFSRPSLNAAKKKSSPPVVNEAQKTTSKYYSQVDYSKYDIVINPVVLEPVVQISYTITVKYFLRAEEKKNNNYYIISPTGEMKQFYPKG
ncbi:MAG: hypothetical protein V2A54_08445 [Bacteroidota bacterium]